MADESNLNRQFRTNMRAERELRGMSQGDLSRRLVQSGWPIFHQTTVARIETGSRPVKLDEAMAIADSLDVDLTRLVSDQDAMAVQRAYQAALRTRDEMTSLAASYFRRQITLAAALEIAPDSLKGADAAEASVIIKEAPGDAAMEGVLDLAAAAEMYSFEEYRALALQDARSAHSKYSRAGTLERLEDEGTTDA